MSTQLHNSPIYGPVHSRRLGLSVGINLMPADGKYCTFDCIYCECGYNHERQTRTPRPTVAEVTAALERQLQTMADDGSRPDVLTFAGNGEPTAHPHFAEIVDATIALRNRYCPDARISVLSNATQLHRSEVREALMMVDNNIQKLDTVDMEYIRRVDRPQQPSYDVKDVINNLKLFNGHVIIQTMFMCGDNTDNTSDKYILPWLEAMKEIKPQQVMVYTIDRETPDKLLRKASHETLDCIKARVEELGIACSASY